MRTPLEDMQAAADHARQQLKDAIHAETEAYNRAHAATEHVAQLNTYVIEYDTIIAKAQA